MSADGYSGAYSVLERRRLEKRALFFAKRDEIYSKLPRVSRLTDEITNLGAEYALAKLEKRTGDAQDVRKKMDILDRERTRILIENGYSRQDLEMQYFCDKCKDTGFVNGKVCDCLKEEIIKRRQRLLSAASPAPRARFEDFNLEFYPKQAKELPNGTFVVPYNHMKQVYEFCKNYAERFTPANKSLLMLGNAGLGKTHLACSIASVCMEKGYTIMYASSQSLFNKVEQARYSGEDIISDILTCDLFILDDLGAENMTSYSLSVLYNIVNTRMITGKPCIYTTNIINQNMLTRKYGEKITSRLLGSCSRLFFVGDDVRILKNSR